MTKTAMVHAQQRWEYLELTRKSESYLLNELNEVGLQGWELVSVDQARDRKGELSWIAFLKRPYVGHGGEPPRPSAAPPTSEEKKVLEPSTDLDEGEEEFKFRDEDAPQG